MAEESLKESEQKYRGLFDSLLEGFILTQIIYSDKGKPIDLRYLEANPACETITGIKREQIIGRTAREVIPNFKENLLQLYVKVAATGEPERYEAYDEFLNQYHENFLFRPAPDQVAVLFRDITKRKKTEEALARYQGELEARVNERTRELAQSEEKYRLLVENANEAVVVFQDEMIRFFNPKALEISGYSPRELNSMSIAEFVHPDDRKMIIGKYLQRIHGGKVSSSNEFRMLHKDGDIRWIFYNAMLITWEGKPAVLALMTDISERKNMEQELKAYAQKITRVQEEERKRIAYELHDDTAQYLSILKMQLDSLLHSGKIDDPAILKKLEHLERDAGRAVDDVRRYSHELRPGVLEHLGLRAALEQTAEDINKLRQITVEMNVVGKERKLSEAVKLGLFRIVQEALNNARKHAGDCTANVSLEFGSNRVKVTVSDNGSGFSLKDIHFHTGLKDSLGIMSMQERAKLIGADLKIESNPGEGTTVTAEVKL